jgi:hypothetical protein
VVGYGPFSLCINHKVGLCPSSGYLNRLITMIIRSIILTSDPFPKGVSRRRFLTVRSSHNIIVIIIISLLMSQCWGTGLPYRLNMRRTDHNPPRGPSAGWWVPTTSNVAGTNGLKCLPKYGGAQDNTFLVTHPMTDHRCLTSTIARRSALTAGPSSSSIF